MQRMIAGMHGAGRHRMDRAHFYTRMVVSRTTTDYHGILLWHFCYVMVMYLIGLLMIGRGTNGI